MDSPYASGPFTGERCSEGAIDPADAEWLRRFHSGSREVLRACYEDHFDIVWQTVGRLLKGADRETVVHEVFFRALFQPEQRLKFRGGALGQWLATLARNHTIDFLRRMGRERPWEEAPSHLREASFSPEAEGDMDFLRMVESFKRDVLPPKWLPVFELRFLRRLSQRESARMLNIGRTTLAYQEMQVRRLLKRTILVKGRS